MSGAAFQPIHLQALKERLREQLPGDSYAAWFAPLGWGEAAAGEVRLLAESEFARSELQDRYLPQIETVLGRLGFSGHAIRLEVEPGRAAAAPQILPFGPPGAAAPATSAPSPAPARPIPVPAAAPVAARPAASARVEPASPAQRAGLIGRLEFSRFEEGPNNNLALAAARRVAETRGAYNPLFIHGGSGLGKTHLLHAIGNTALASDPSANLILTSGQGFVNDHVTATRQDTHEQFKRRYWLADLLLIDDIHILAGKPGSMQTFFEVFNAIHENGGQIVLTSDQAPRKIEGLEERLRTRFEWGLLADIQPYPLEVRVKILKRKAAEQRSELPDETAWFMASRLQKNVRELEGALEKVKLTAELRGEPLGLELAREALAGDLPQAGRQLSMEKIVEQVAANYHLAARDLTGPGKLKKVTEARHVAVWLVNRLTGLSNAEIARRLGNRNPSTIHHALKKIELEMHQDGDFARRVEALEQQLI